MTQMPIMNYINEIKLRLSYTILSFFATFITSYYYSDLILYILAKPLGRHLIYTNITEAFFTYIELSLWIALLFLIPVFLFEVWLFIIPGLYLYERQILNYLFFVFFFFIIISLLLGFLIIIPLIIKFFLGFEINSLELIYNINLEAKIYDYMKVIFKFLFLFCILLQIPNIFIILFYFNLIQFDFLLKMRKVFALIILILAAIISPPDILSQVAIFIPIMIIFECSIFFIRLLEIYKSYSP